MHVVIYSDLRQENCVFSVLKYCTKVTAGMFPCFGPYSETELADSCADNKSYYKFLPYSRYSSFLPTTVLKNY